MDDALISYRQKKSSIYQISEGAVPSPALEENNQHQTNKDIKRGMECAKMVCIIFLPATLQISHCTCLLCIMHARVSSCRPMYGHPAIKNVPPCRVSACCIGQSSSIRSRRGWDAVLYAPGHPSDRDRPDLPRAGRPGIAAALRPAEQI